jgi:hypothetical protein
MVFSGLQTQLQRGEELRTLSQSWTMIEIAKSQIALQY